MIRRAPILGRGVVANRARSGAAWNTWDLSALVVGQNPGQTQEDPGLLGARTSDSLQLLDPSPTSRNDTSLQDYATLYEPAFSIAPGASGTIELNLHATTGLPEGLALCIGYTDSPGDLTTSPDLQGFAGLRKANGQQPQLRVRRGSGFTTSPNDAAIVQVYARLSILAGQLEDFSWCALDSSSAAVAGAFSSSSANASTGDASTIRLALFAALITEGAGDLAWGGLVARHRWIPLS